MNKMIIAGFVPSFLISLSLFCSNFPELSKLPKESKIRNVCEQTPGNPWFLRTYQEQACDVLNKQMYNSYHRALEIAEELPAKVANCNEYELRRLVGEFITQRGDLLNVEIHAAIDSLLPNEPYIEKIEEHKVLMDFPIVSAIKVAKLLKLVNEQDKDKK